MLIKEKLKISYSDNVQLKLNYYYLWEGTQNDYSKLLTEMSGMHDSFKYLLWKKAIIVSFCWKVGHSCAKVYLLRPCSQTVQKNETAQFKSQKKTKWGYGLKSLNLKMLSQHLEKLFDDLTYLYFSFYSFRFSVFPLFKNWPNLRVF